MQRKLSENETLKLIQDLIDAHKLPCGPLEIDENTMCATICFSNKGNTYMLEFNVEGRVSGAWEIIEKGLDRVLTHDDVLAVHEALEHGDLSSLMDSSATTHTP